MKKNKIFEAAVVRDNSGFLFPWDEVSFENILFVVGVIEKWNLKHPDTNI